MIFMFNHFYERKVNNKIFSFQTNIARLGALTRGYPNSIRVPLPLDRLGFYFRRVQPGQSSAPKIDVHFMTAIMVSTLIGLVALVLRRSTSNFYVAWGRSLMYSAPTIVLTLKDMFGSADLFCTS